MQLRLDPPVAGAVTVCGLGIDRSRPSPQVAVIASHQLAIDANGNCLHLLALAGADDPSVVLQLVDASAERSTSAGHWRKTFLLLMLMWLLAMSWMTFKVSRTAIGRRWIGMAGPAASAHELGGPHGPTRRQERAQHRRRAREPWPRRSWPRRFRRRRPRRQRAGGRQRKSWRRAPRRCPRLPGEGCSARSARRAPEFPQGRGRLPSTVIVAHVPGTSRVRASAR